MIACLSIQVLILQKKIYTTELVRHQKRREDVSFQTKTDIGTKAKDAAMTIVQTAKKLKVNSYRYFLDRVSQSLQLPSLVDLITENSS